MIDTPEKRRAVGGLNYFGGPGVTPNAAKDVAWRQEAAWGYPGIAPEPPSTGSGGDLLLLGAG